MIVELYSHAIAAVFGFGVSLVCYMICHSMIESAITNWVIYGREIERNSNGYNGNRNA